MNDETWKEGDDQCDGEDTELVVAQWKDVQDPATKPALILRDFNDIRFRQNGEGYTIAFVPEGTTDIPKPPSAANLAELGAADAGGTGTTQPTAPGDTGSTVPADPNATTAPARGGPHRHHRHPPTRRPPPRREAECEPSCWWGGSARGCARSRSLARSRCCRCCTGP